MYGYCTPPPQDRARRTRDRMINVFIYNLLTYVTGIIYIIAVDLGVSIVVVLLGVLVFLLICLRCLLCRTGGLFLSCCR